MGKPKGKTKRNRFHSTEERTAKDRKGIYPTCLFFMVKEGTAGGIRPHPLDTGRYYSD